MRKLFLAAVLVVLADPLAAADFNKVPYPSVRVQEDFDALYASVNIGYSWFNFIFEPGDQLYPDWPERLYRSLDHDHATAWLGAVPVVSSHTRIRERHVRHRMGRFRVSNR